MARQYWRWATEEDIRIAKRLRDEIVDYAEGRGYTGDQFYSALLWLLAVGLAGLPKEERKRVIGQLEWAADQGDVVIGGSWWWPSEEDKEVVRRIGIELEHYAKAKDYSGDQFHNTILRFLAQVLASYFKEERKRVIGELEWMADNVYCLRCGKHLFDCECGWKVINMWGYPSR